MRPTCKFRFPPGPKLHARLLLDAQHRCGTRFSMYARKSLPAEPERRLELLRALGFVLPDDEVMALQHLAQLEQTIGAAPGLPLLVYLERLVASNEPQQATDPNDPRFELALA